MSSWLTSGARRLKTRTKSGKAAKSLPHGYGHNDVRPSFSTRQLMTDNQSRNSNPVVMNRDGVVKAFRGNNTAETAANDEFLGTNINYDQPNTNTDRDYYQERRTSNDFDALTHGVGQKRIAREPSERRPLHKTFQHSLDKMQQEQHQNKLSQSQSQPHYYNNYQSYSQSAPISNIIHYESEEPQQQHDWDNNSRQFNTSLQIPPESTSSSQSASFVRQYEEQRAAEQYQRPSQYQQQDRGGEGGGNGGLCIFSPKQKLQQDYQRQYPQQQQQIDSGLNKFRVRKTRRFVVIIYKLLQIF